MPENAAQLSLNVRLRDDATLDNLLPTDANAAAAAAVAEGSERLLFLHGPREGGKSHLLQAACHAQGESALYLPLGILGDCCPGDLLQDVENLALVCIDDLHLVAGDQHWERALFHFYNRAQASGCRLCIAADAPPPRLALGLADLASRLSAGVAYALGAPDDRQRMAILKFRAQRRGLLITDDVATYILTRAQRSLHQLILLLDQLDTASLVAQRPLSLPFIKQTLQW